MKNYLNHIMSNFSFKQKISKLSNQERDNWNKIIYFAISWWLKDLEATTRIDVQTMKVDRFNNIIKKEQPSINHHQLENLKYILAIDLLKEMLNASHQVTLYTSIKAEGILLQALKEANLESLSTLLAQHTKMIITCDTITIIEDHKEPIIFPVSNHEKSQIDFINTIGTKELKMVNHMQS